MKIIWWRLNLVLVVGRRAKTKEDENTNACIVSLVENNNMEDATVSPAIHPAIAPLSYLLGTWRGRGEGGFPTINSFSYVEQLHFSHAGKVPHFSF